MYSIKLSTEKECRTEERKMIGFLAEKIWDIMTIPELRVYFTDKERDTVNAIRNRFTDKCTSYYLDEKEMGWNKTV